MLSPLVRSFILALLLLSIVAEIQADEFDLRNELILDLRLNGEPLQTDVIAYQRGGDLFVSLAELADGLRFPITVDVRGGRAGGWFISEEREFALDLNTATVISGGETLALDPSAVVVFKDGLYVNTKSLQTWFPLRLEPLLRKLALNVEATETLPVQEQMQRRAGRTRGRGTVSMKPQLPFQETPYHWLGPHTTDLRISTSSVRNGDDASPSQSANYSLLSRGELAKMTSNIFLTGREDQITAGRVRLEREMSENPLNLNLVEVGDVTTGGARGLLLRGGPTRGSLEGRFAGESIDLRGDILPGWEVELYRNGVLLDFQLVGDEGQYEFLQVPMVLGENRFEFILLGPFGEERREEEVYFVGPGVLDWGAVSYELAAVQSERTVLGLNEGEGSEDRNSMRYLANVNVGLGRNLSARAGVDSFEEEGRRLENYDAGLNLTLNAVQASTAYSFRPEEQDILTSSLRSRLGSARMSLGYTQFYSDGLDQDQLGTNPARWRGSASLSIRPWQVPFSMEASHTNRTFSSNTDASIATSLRAGFNHRLSTSLNYSLQDDRDLGLGREESLSSNVNFATSLRPWRLRAGLRYGILPESDLVSIDASASLRVDRNMTMNVEVRRNRTSSRTSYLAGFNWQLDSFQLSPRISYDSEERMVGLVSLSTSLVPRPGRLLPAFQRVSHANSGQVRARVFIDNDGDGQFGAGDQALEGVRVDAVQAFRHAETGKDGNAYLSNLPGRLKTDIALDPASLPDLELEPAYPGRSVLPRVGSITTVDLPVYRSVELEGHVRVSTDDGPKPAKRILVILVDGNGDAVTRQRTAFDGFFVFSGVPPGEYRLRLGSDSTARVMESPGKFTLTGQGGVRRGLDFMLEQEAQRTLIDSVPGGREGGSFVPESGDAVETLLNSGSSVELSSEPEPKNERVSNSDFDASWYVQLGAFGEPSNARAYWRELLAGDVLPDTLQPRFESAGNLTRLLAGPGRSEAEARDLCRRIKSQGADCLVREVN